MVNAGNSFDFVRIIEASRDYGDAHRGLLKMVIDRGSLSERAFCAHFVRCCASRRSSDGAADDLLSCIGDGQQLNLSNVTAHAVSKLRDELVDRINAKVQSVGMRLIKVRDELTNKKMIILVSERHYSTALAAASPFDKNELYLVVFWLEEMLKPDNDGYIPITHALKSASALPVPMKMEKAQSLIEELLRAEWLRKESGGMLTLSTRGLAELGPILRSRYHCPACFLCSNIAIRKASMLSCEECECLMHVSCWKNLAETVNKDAVQCPAQVCKKEINKADMNEAIRRIEEARMSRTRMASSDSDEAGSSVEEERRRSEREMNKFKKGDMKRSLVIDSDEDQGEEDLNEAESAEEEQDEVFTKRKPRKHAHRMSHNSAKSNLRQKAKNEEDDDVQDENL